MNGEVANLALRQCLMNGEVAPGSASPVPTRGELRGTSVPGLLWRLHVARASGRLSLRNGELSKSMWMTYGQPVFARSNLPNDRLTERLRQRGLLTREEFEAAQVAIEENRGRRRIGQILLAARLIPKRVLDESLHEQLLWILDSMLTWREGSWEFDEDSSCDESVTLNVPMSAILMEGARNRLPIEQQWATIGLPDAVPQLVLRGDHARALMSLEDDLRLYPSERLCLRRLTEGKSLRALLEDFDTDERELISLVYTLRLIGKLQLVEPAGG